MLVDNIRPKLKSVILESFERWERQQQSVVRQSSRISYLAAFYNFFNEVFTRIDDSRFLDSFYDQVTRLYLEVESNSVFITQIIEIAIEILDEDIDIRHEILYSGKKNNFDLIINYSVGILSNVLRLAEIDSAKLLQLINFYSQYDFPIAKPSIKLLRKTDEPQRLLRRRFADIHKRRVYEAAAATINNVEKINEAISDTADYMERSFFSKPIPNEVLQQSWAGAGLSIYENCKDLDSLSKFFGRSEDSVSGEIDLMQRFLEILKTTSFGSGSEVNAHSIGGENYFGRFNQLFAASGVAAASIWGLDFLRPLTKTRAFQSVHPTLDPIEYLFKNGIKNRIGAAKLGYREATGVLPISLYLDSLLRKAYKIGGSVLSVLYSLDSNGRLKYYEGLGNLKYPLEAMAEVFPVKLTGYRQGNIGGLIGALENLVAGITRSQEHIYSSAFPGKTLSELVPWFDILRNKLETIQSTIKTVGAKPGDIIPNVPLSVSGRTREDYAEYFKKLGYSQSDTEMILSSGSMSDLLRNFGGKATSADAKSFMRGYDLSKLVYSIAGENGVKEMLDYMMAPDEQGLARLYSLLELKQDQFLKIDQYKYGKLIGALYSVQRAASTLPIERLIPLLKAKNSTIGQSLKIVSDFGLDSPLKDSFEIDIVAAIINQSSSGYAASKQYLLDMDCSGALTEAPISLRKWVGLIDESAGSANKDQLFGYLSNRPGITYKELIEVLNLEDNPGYSLLSGVISGSRGGELTRVLRDIQASGLAVLMRHDHGNSRRFNSVVPELEQDSSIVDLLDNIQELTLDIQLTVYRLLISSEETPLSTLEADAISYDSVLNAINKPLSVATSVVEALRPDISGRLPYKYNRTSLEEIIEQAPLAEAPGIGNSARIPRRFKQGTLSHELASRISGEPAPRLQAAAPGYAPGFVPFIKIDQESTVQQRHLVKGESTGEGYYNPGDYFEAIPEEDLEQLVAEPLFRTSAITAFTDPESEYIKSAVAATITSPVSGSYILSISNSESDAATMLKPAYDPVKACENFGTSSPKCKQLFKDYVGLECLEYRHNKSSLIEDNIISDRLSNTDSIPIDRPLGVAGSISPSAVFVPNYYKNLPYYLERNGVSASMGLGSNGEPLGLEATMDTLGWENTTMGLNDFLKEYSYPKDEQECSKYEQTSLVHKCMNLLRCRKLELNKPSFCNGVKA